MSRAEDQEHLRAYLRGKVRELVAGGAVKRSDTVDRIVGTVFIEIARDVGADLKSVLGAEGIVIATGGVLLATNAGQELVRRAGSALLGWITGGPRR